MSKFKLRINNWALPILRAISSYTDYPLLGLCYLFGNWLEILVKEVEVDKLSFSVDSMFLFCMTLTVNGIGVQSQNEVLIKEWCKSDNLQINIPEFGSIFDYFWN